MVEQLKKLGFQKDPVTLVWKQENQCDFSYSDGDEIENFLLESIRSCQDRSISSEELKHFIRDWPTLYHLSRRRVNILRPFALYLKGKKVLEIGCGCGALSRYLGEIGANVVSVEGSPRRALIARERCKDLYNVEFVVATSELVAGLRDFDVVILNGVLEYSPKYIGIDGPAILLKTSYEQLNDKGVLILAIENQLGLKYFAGQPEDHAGMPMYGINDSYKEGEFKTWGKKELSGMLGSAGFKFIEQFIPLPDYKFPISVITPLGWQNYTEELSQLAIESVFQDPQRTPFDLFSLEMAYKTTWKNGLAGDLANSFLMIASKESLPQDLISSHTAAFHYSDGRKKGFNKGLEIFQTDTGLKVKNFPLDGFVDNENNSLIKINRLELDNFYYGESLWFELLCILNRPAWTTEEVVSWAKSWVNALTEKAGISSDASIDTIIDGKFWDATPFNTIRQKDGSIQFFDLEWEVKEKMTLGQVMFHGLFHSFLRITTIARPSDNSLELMKIIELIFHDLGFKVSLEKILEITQKDTNFIKLLVNTPKYEQQEIDFLSIVFRRRLSLGDLTDELGRLNWKIGSIYNSTSWKITKPLRKIGKIL